MNDIKMLQERHDNKPHLKRPHLPPVKKIDLKSTKKKAEKK